MPDNIKSTFRLFADDTSFFCYVVNKDISQDKLNYDSQKLSDWGFHWKMKFNPGPNKQVQELIFAKEAENNNFPSFIFNKTEVRTLQSQKHLGLTLDERPKFTEHISSKTSKCDKLIGITKKWYISFLEKALLRIYKSFFRQTNQWVI